MTMDENTKQPNDPDPLMLELVSALADGQLRGTELLQTLASFGRDEHLVGDLLRSSDLSVRANDSAFLAVMANRLARGDASQPVQEASMPERRAANDGQFRWKALAGVASLIAVAAFGWGASGRSAPQGEQLAQSVAAPVAVAQVPEQAMIRDAHLDELLAAHKQWGSGTALQMPAGFLRNATFEVPAR